MVFCHGLFGQGKNWTQVAKVVAERHRVLLLDMPQHGRSPWTPDFDYLDAADQVAASLPDEPVAVVGHSMGGKIAMALALLHPERVERLCVVDVAPVAYDSAHSFDRYVAAMRGLDLHALAARADAERALTDAVPDPVVRGFLLQNLRRYAGRLRLALAAEPRGHRRPPRRDHRLAGGAGGRRCRRTTARCCGCAATGPSTSADEHADAMAALFPRVRKVTIKGSGHWVHSEQPEAFTSVLRHFLGDG